MIAETGTSRRLHAPPERIGRLRRGVGDQQGTRPRVAVAIAGDVDELGLERLSSEQRLDFDGIRVQLDGVATVAEATAQLAEYTDLAGLRGADAGHNVRFMPIGGRVRAALPTFRYHADPVPRSARQRAAPCERRALRALLATLGEDGHDGEDAEEMVDQMDDSPIAYHFQCLHCGTDVVTWDCD